MARVHRPFRLAAVVTTAALMTSACSSDPAVWDAVARGLEMAADDLAWENANCYWAPPPGAYHGVNQRYCPGDYGYRDLGPLPASYYRDNYREARRDQRRDRDHDRRDHRKRD